MLTIQVTIMKSTILISIIIRSSCFLGMEALLTAQNIDRPMPEIGQQSIEAALY